MTWSNAPIVLMMRNVLLSKQKKPSRPKAARSSSQFTVPIIGDRGATGN